MKLHLSIIFIAFGYLLGMSQNSILYDLDSYKRVDLDYRITTFSPDVLLTYNKKINTPGQEKRYGISLGGVYNDSHLINSKNRQRSVDNSIDLSSTIGTNKYINLSYRYSSQNRNYSDLTYFKNGFYISSLTNYNDNPSSLKDFSQSLYISYDIGFGFGRHELINHAWIGARILEELEKKALLKKIPEASEMKLFFDLIGDLEYERIMDSRLKDIYRLEKIIEYIEQNEWIEKGSIPAFVTINDAFSYELFINRFSGDRLEFTLTPIVKGSYDWRESINFLNPKEIEPGFEGNIEYEVYSNGDLEYYTRKLIGARLGYFNKLLVEDIDNTKIIRGNFYFSYKYRYIPSLRTNLEISTYVSGNIVKTYKYSSSLSAYSRLDYNYYFSPSTQLVLSAQINYNDTEFQINEFQPSIGTMFSVDVVHAIR